jgi:hypothetical protein
MERPNYDACDDRLKARIDAVAEIMLANVWTAVFRELDDTNHRFVMFGEDAGRLAQVCVDAIKNELPECLAK